jgi:SAM-dependent methyltransferase
VGFEAEWLAARAPYDEAALDPSAVCAIRAWGALLDGNRLPVVVDLGSGTGAALRRVRRWLKPREIVAYAVDHDPVLLLAGARHANGSAAILGSALEPLEAHGGPADGSVDLVVGHALADLVPLDRLAERAAALVRPGGLVHLALAYDGLTAFSPVLDAALEAEIIRAFHEHMDRPSLDHATYGGSTAGRRLGPALRAGGLEIVSDGISTWKVHASDGVVGRSVLDRLVRFVVDAVREIGSVPEDRLAGWETERQRAIESDMLSVHVGHRDVLARAPQSQDCDASAAGAGKSNICAHSRVNGHR